MLAIASWVSYGVSSPHTEEDHGFVNARCVNLTHVGIVGAVVAGVQGLVWLVATYMYTHVTRFIWVTGLCMRAIQAILILVNISVGADACRTWWFRSDATRQVMGLVLAADVMAPLLWWLIFRLWARRYARRQSRAWRGLPQLR